MHSRGREGKPALDQAITEGAIVRWQSCHISPHRAQSQDVILLICKASQGQKFPLPTEDQLVGTQMRGPPRLSLPERDWKGCTIVKDRGKLLPMKLVKTLLPPASAHFPTAPRHVDPKKHVPYAHQGFGIFQIAVLECCFYHLNLAVFYHLYPKLDYAK